MFNTYINNQKTNIKINTGMNRLGLRGLNELKKAIAVLETNELINIEGIFTHFSSDEFESNYFEKQLNEFKNMIKTKNYQIIHANATRNINKEIIVFGLFSALEHGVNIFSAIIVSLL